MSELTDGEWLLVLTVIAAMLAFVAAAIYIAYVALIGVCDAAVDRSHANCPTKCQCYVAGDGVEAVNDDDDETSPLDALERGELTQPLIAPQNEPDRLAQLWQCMVVSETPSTTKIADQPTTDGATSARLDAPPPITAAPRTAASEPTSTASDKPSCDEASSEIDCEPPPANLSSTFAEIVVVDEVADVTAPSPPQTPPDARSLLSPPSLVHIVAPRRASIAAADVRPRVARSRSAPLANIRSSFDGSRRTFIESLAVWRRRTNEPDANSPTLDVDRDINTTP